MRVGIAGAGLMGRLMAWRLLREGHRVQLFDGDVVDGERSAARVAAAMLAPYSEAVACERAVFDGGLASLAIWPGLLRELSADCGQRVDFQQRGSVIVAHPRDRSLLQRFGSLLQERLPDRRAHISRLDRPALAALEPSLAATFDEGLHLGEEGCLDNRALLLALAAAIRALGGQWREGASVESVSPGRIDTAEGAQRFDLAIDARGVGARAQAPGLRGVRGEILWVAAVDVNLSRPVRLMHPRYQLYVAPKPGRVYAIGATEIESDSMAPVTVRSSMELLSALYSLHKGFAEAHIIHSFANCRPAYMNNQPRIDAGDGLLRINGLYRHGFLLAPLVLQLAMACLRGEGEHPWVSGYSCSEGAGG